jgi:hypothetical protein
MLSFLRNNVVIVDSLNPRLPAIVDSLNPRLPAQFVRRREIYYFTLISIGAAGFTVREKDGESQTVSKG